MAKVEKLRAVVKPREMLEGLVGVSPYMLPLCGREIEVIPVTEFPGVYEDTLSGYYWLEEWLDF